MRPIISTERLWTSFSVAACVWHLAVASALTHDHGGDADTEDLSSQSSEGRLSASVSATGSIGSAPSRRIMRTERLESEESSAPFADIMEVFNSTLPPQTIVTHDGLTTTEQPTTELQNCRWYDWSPWSYCSKSCGEGWKSRKRTVAIQPRNGGTQCDGPSEDLEICNEFDCPIDCEWGVWNDWSGCTASCDGGTRQRGKPIKLQNNTLGKPCSPAEGIQIEDCKTQACSRDCEWADWTSWGACSTSCGGGVKLRTRSVQDDAVGGGRQCEGASRDEEACSLKACPQDCELGDWSAWTTCSVSCGNGTSLRERKIVSREAEGGKPCSGALEQENPCYQEGCPVDCLWDDWSEWTECSTSCGSNVSLWATSTRQRAVTESLGGKPCLGEEKRRTLCGQSPCPVECVWDDWGEWKACTKSCGSGITERLRNVSIPAAHGGEDCMGSTRDVKKCARNPCPQDCRFGDWEDWSECSKPCGEGSAIRYRVVSTPAAHGGQMCFGARHQTGGCNGTDCVTTEELIRKGLATQITGAMHIITEDPISYAATPLVEQVTREALAEFAELPVRRIHVSMMPDVTKSQDVIDWFSMLVPNSTNLSAVVNHISSKDLYEAGKILRTKLRRVGVSVLVNISKMSVHWDPFGIKSAGNASSENSSTSSPAPAWDNPNATRLTGVVKMVVPQPLKFAEDLKAKEATERLLSELSGITQAGVHASLIPDQVYHYEAEFGTESADSQASIPSDSVKNATGEVHAWFSLVGGVQSAGDAALAEARKIAAAMMAQDLDDATVRENFFLDGVGLPNADSKVIQILAKADGDQYQVEDTDTGILEDCKSCVRVTGVVEMITDYPNTFSADRRSEEGLQQAISQLAGVSFDSVRVALVPSDQSRIDSLLQSDADEVTTHAPLDEEEAFGNEVSAWFVITIPLTSKISGEDVVQKLEKEDLTLTSLKVQNCIVDEGLDLTVKVGRITAVIQTTTTTTAATGVIKKVDFGTSGTSESGTAFGEGDQTVAGSGQAAETAVSGDTATGPAKVVAVVAAVSPEDVEPPTMSNPGGGDEESDDAETTETKAPDNTTGASLLEGLKSFAVCPSGSSAVFLAVFLKAFHGS